ncbi:MAG: helix-turn-helix domain-containing protein [Parasporobacterium sp.]|nr:helix-turn-helix domain-containing protein [Parasporobacterium sp.]
MQKDVNDYFIRMQNAELETEKLRKKPPEVEQLEFQYDELLKDYDSLKAKLEDTKKKLTESQKTAREYKRQLDKLERNHKATMNALEISKQSIANKDTEIANLKATAASVPQSVPVTVQVENPKRGRPSVINDDLKKRVIELSQQGCSVRTIAKVAGIGSSTVQRILHESKSMK